MNATSASRYRVLVFSGALLLLAVCAAVLPVRFKEVLHLKGTLHPWLHLILFGVLAAVAERLPRRVLTKIAMLLLLALFGAGTELMESLEFHVSIEYIDIWTDIAGIVFGASLALLIEPMRTA